MNNKEDTPTEPKSAIEQLTGNWLHDGITLITAFTKAAAENNGFNDVKITPAPFDSGTPEQVNLIVSFSSASIKGCRNARPKRIEDGIYRFERDMLDINGALDRNLNKDQGANDIQYTLPLKRYEVPEIVAAIKGRLAEKLPVSAYIAHLESPKR